MSVWMLEDIPNEYKSSTVQITSYDNKRVAGTFENSYYGQKLNFNNLMQLLIILENLQRATGYPRSSTEARTFGEEDFDSEYITEIRKNPPSPISIKEQSFRIHILFRQNSSWQGTMLWIQRHKEAQFRSALELIALIDSAMRNL